MYSLIVCMQGQRVPAGIHAIFFSFNLTVSLIHDPLWDITLYLAVTCGVRLALLISQIVLIFGDTNNFEKYQSNTL